MRKRLPTQVILAIMTTVTVVVWVIFSVYQELKTEHSPQLPKEVLEPINPELDTQTLELIKEKLYFEKGSTVAFSSQSAIINLVPDRVNPTETPTPQEQEESVLVAGEEQTASSAAEIVE